MALKQSPGLFSRTPATVPFYAGEIVAQAYEFSFDKDGLLAADVLEVGCLPAGCKLHRATLTTASIAATTTVSAGVLSGAFGTKDDTRTLPGTADIVSAGTKNTVIDVTPGALFGVDVADTDRGIGIKLSANEADDKGSGGTIILEYYKP